MNIDSLNEFESKIDIGTGKWFTTTFMANVKLPKGRQNKNTASDTYEGLVGLSMVADHSDKMAFVLGDIMFSLDDFL